MKISKKINKICEKEYSELSDKEHETLRNFFFKLYKEGLHEKHKDNY